MNQNSHAIIIGGGIIGLVTARLFAEFYNKVTIIEVENITLGDFTPRKKLTHGEQVHFLPPQGLKILSYFFPDIEKILSENNSLKVMLTKEWRLWMYGWQPSYESDRYTYAQSRTLLEACVRLSLHNNYSNIEYLYGNEALGLLSNFKENRITGVRVINHNTNEQSNLYGDFIADVSGRYTRVPNWLEELGYQKPEHWEAKIDIHYLTRFFRPSENYHPNFKIMTIKTLPPMKKYATMTFIEPDKEGRRFILTIGGQYDVSPVNSEAGFLDFVKKLPCPDYEALVKNSEPISDLNPFFFPTASRYLYENVNSLPSRFIAIGDSLFSHSPVFGIGITSGLLCTKILHEILKEKKETAIDTLNQNYFKSVSKTLDIVWQLNGKISLLNDIPQNRWPLSDKLALTYQKKVLELSSQDVDVWKKINSPSRSKNNLAFFYPSIISKVIANHVKKCFT